MLSCLQAFKRANSLPAILDLYRGELDLGEDSTPPSAATTDPVRHPGLKLKIPA